MDTPINQLIFKKYLKPTLIILAVIFVIGLLFYLLGISFNLIVFYQLWSFLVTKIVGITGISQWLVKGIVILVLIPILWVIPNLFVSKYRKTAIIVGLVYFSVFFLSMFFLSRDVYFAHSNKEALKWYALTPEGVKLYDSPGVDPVYGIELKPVTPDVIQKLRLLQKGEFKPTDPENDQFFNPITGEAQLWYYKFPDGKYEFYDKPGFHPATGESLKPVTKQVYFEWKNNLKYHKQIQHKETDEDSQAQQINQTPTINNWYTEKERFTFNGSPNQYYAPEFSFKKGETVVIKVLCCGSVDYVTSDGAPHTINPGETYEKVISCPNHCKPMLRASHFAQIVLYKKR